MKKQLTLLLIITAFTSNAQRTMFTGQNNYVAPVVTFQPPAIVTSGLIAYLDASDPTSYPGAGSTWIDKQGFANGTINGNINFVANGNASYFSLPGLDNAYINSSTSQVYKDFTIVFQPDFSSFNYAGGHTLFSKGPGVDMSMRFWTYDLISQTGTVGNTANVWVTPDGSNNWTNTADWAWDNTNSSKLYHNGVFKNSHFPLISGWNILGGTNSGNWGSFPYCLGAGYNTRAFQGKIAFVLFYNRVLTAAEQLQNFNALKSRFGL